MFKCDCCHKITQPGEIAEKVIVEERKATYECVVSKIIGQGRNKETVTRRFTAEGHEIVKEYTVCTQCASIHRGLKEAKEGKVTELNLNTLEGENE